MGGQAMPVYNSIIAVSPDKALVIFSNESHNLAEKLQNILQKEKPDLSLEILGPVDSYAQNKITEYAKTIAEKYRDDNVIIDITGGIKSWNYLFPLVISKVIPTCEVIYIDQNNYIWNYTKCTKTKNFNSASTMTMLSLQGSYNLSSFTPFEEFTQKDTNACKTIEDLRRKYYKIFNELTINKNNDREKNELLKQKHGRITSLLGNSYIEWEKSEGYSTVYFKTTTAQGKEIMETISSPHAFHLVFNTGWFEYKVARLLNNTKLCKEIYMNCIFTDDNGIDINEVDIIANIRGKLLFVECKTRVSKPTDMDKFSAVVKTYGGLGSKSMLVTEGNIQKLIENKCKEFNIHIFSCSEMDPLERLRAKITSFINVSNIK